MTDLRRIVTEILQSADLTQNQLAKRLNVTQPTVSRWVKGAKPELEHRDAILAEASRLGIMNGRRLHQSTVPIVGYVGAGAEAHFYNDNQGDMGEAPMPQGAGQGTVAVVVQGDSLQPLAEDNWLLYYENRLDPPTDDLFGKLCVIGLADGRVLAKKLYPGKEPGLFNLLSFNSKPLMDIPVEWAAEVTWIKPR